MFHKNTTSNDRLAALSLLTSYCRLSTAMELERAKEALIKAGFLKFEDAGLPRHSITLAGLAEVRHLAAGWNPGQPDAADLERYVADKRIAQLEEELAALPGASEFAAMSPVEQATARAKEDIAIAEAQAAYPAPKKTYCYYVVLAAPTPEGATLHVSIQLTRDTQITGMSHLDAIRDEAVRQMAERHRTAGDEKLAKRMEELPFITVFWKEFP